ncbi:radical SAM/SPASM domain-containing protein [Mesorhizobium sp. M7A.F.Ca.MR.362.00.0.0]|uniref:radical SAM/SPASM domain-containing protein n=1 Tax=Mesorhizobium sp. M7A.F.Ca.MR.362.00.0.0 TaxID=2496779 RepID=UPI000FD5B5E6|nr:radical SAM/SPASM domain-containing protein [Mesorhizobium sp. M7A.F.Ca.MR.362.00.0.0]RUU82747.1 hypothetical protein EOC06_02855 [Mesorhizobium sp. M7A.F.Ca.MR.362.00.0.0]RWN96575.1 MAG: hypothetical protein EOS05_01120 [Mesorhizobium sp.]
MNAEQIQRFLDADLTFNALVMEVTSRCNAKCAMCYQAAGPKGSDLLGDYRLEVDEIAICMMEARECRAIFPRFHFAGGEAFTDIGRCEEIVSIAKQLRYFQITATTNGYWASSPKKADLVCRKMKDAGLTGVEISWDYWHSPFIKATAVDNCIRACSQAGIDVNLRILGTKSHSYGEALDELSSDVVSLAHKVICGPVFRTGRAEKTMPEDEFTGIERIDGACFEQLNFTISPNGAVSPCCAGFDQRSVHDLGNIKTATVRDLYERMNSDTILRMLVFLGPKFLAANLMEPDRKQVARNICELCWSIFGSRDRYEELAVKIANWAEGEKSLLRLQ